jgi:hypothetical protein
MSLFNSRSSNNALGGSDLSVYVTDPLTSYIDSVVEKIDESL